MSSVVVSTSAALGRPFVFDDEAVSKERPSTLSFRPPSASEGRRNLGFENLDPKLAKLTPASHLQVRPAPEMAPSGIAAIDALTGGLPRGCLTEICGPASSGRTTLLLAALTAATARGEFCAVVDASDALDPHSVTAAGVDLDRLLWVRCGEDHPTKTSPQKSRVTQNGCPISRASLAREACPELVEWVGLSSQAAFKFDQTGLRQSEHCLEQLLRATDLLLESGGFGLIALDICDVTQQAARRIPLTTWFRFRRAVEHKPTILLAFEQHPIAGSCSSLLLKLGHPNDQTLAALDGSAAEQRKNAAYACPERSRRGASRGLADEDEKAPKEQKKICSTAQTTFDLKKPALAQLLTKLEITASLNRSRLERKPARPASIAFTSKTAWAG
jgi:hypothetical protein